MAGGESARARRTTPRRRSASRATRAPAHIERIDSPLGERTALRPLPVHVESQQVSLGGGIWSPPPLPSVAPTRVPTVHSFLRLEARAGAGASCSTSGRKSTRRSPSGAMSTAPGDKVNAQRPPQRAQSDTSHVVPIAAITRVGENVSSQYGGMDETCPVSTEGRGGGGETVFDVEPQLPACRRRPPGVAVVDAPAREGGSECRVGTRVGAIVGRGGGGR